MKKFLFVLFLMPLIAQAQVRTVKVFDDVRSGISLSAITEGESTDIFFIGRNNKYKDLVDIIPLFKGSPDDFIALLYRIESFIKENKISEGETLADDIQGISVVYVIKNKSPLANIYTPEGYHSLTLKNIQQLKEAMSKFKQPSF